MVTDTSHIYLNTLCKENPSSVAVDDILTRYGHSVLDQYTQQGKRWKSARIEDSSVALGVVRELDRLREEYPKLRYLLLVQDAKAEQKGQFRVHINRQGRKIVTMKAKKRTGLRD